MTKAREVVINIHKQVDVLMAINVTVLHKCIPICLIKHVMSLYMTPNEQSDNSVKNSTIP